MATLIKQPCLGTPDFHCDALGVEGRNDWRQEARCARQLFVLGVQKLTQSSLKWVLKQGQFFL